MRAGIISYALLLLAGVALARTRTLNVVSFAKKGVQVRVNNKNPVAMEPYGDKQPFYSVTVDADSSDEYRYVEDGKEEDFHRKFPSDASNTFNDFFGRKDTIKRLPQVPLPFGKNKLWTRGMGQVSPFNETYIPTVHFTGQDVMKFFKKPKQFKDLRISCSAFFILQNEVKFFKNVQLEASNTRFPKFAIRMELQNNEKFYGRDVFKFRFGENDPTFLREKLYTDLLVAVGAPVHQTGLARVYAKGTPIGLYILQDDTADDMFIQSEFYAKGNVPSEMGYPLDAGTGADFLWTDQSRDPKDWWDSFVPNTRKRAHATNDRVVELSRALHKLDVTNPEAVKEFDKKWFDIDTFFKAMALEYALGHWDSYWGLTTNFVVYDDPNESDKKKGSYKFYFLDQDFEFSFGSCLNEHFNEFGDKFTKQSYTTLLDRDWKVEPLDAKRRTMIDKLIPKPKRGSPKSELTKRFESILTEIVKHLLNPDGLFGRIDALADRYREELEWDRSLTRLRAPRMNYHWNLEDFEFGINGYPSGYTKAENAGVAWALKPYIQERADAVAKEFKFNYRKVTGQQKHLVTQPGEQQVEDVQKTEQTESVAASKVEKTKMTVLSVVLVVTAGIASIIV